MELCDAGYYCNLCLKKQCPYGSTTENNGAASINECFFTSGQTFSDHYGSFSIPTKMDLSNTLKTMASEQQ